MKLALLYLLYRRLTVMALLSRLSMTVILGCLVCFAQNPTGVEGWVVLPVEDYRSLRQAAFPVQGEASPPPVEATLTRVDYDLQIDGDLASGEAKLTIDVIKDGWVRVAIPGGLMVRQAHLNGQPVSLVTATQKGDPAKYVLLSRTGRAVLMLQVVIPVSTVAGTEMLQLPAGKSAITRATASLQGRSEHGIEVRVAGGLLVEKSESQGSSRWVANGRANEALTFSWRRRVQDQRAAQTLRLRGVLTQHVGLGEDTTQVNAEVRFEVLQGLTEFVRLELPEHFNVNQVSGAMVADWETSNRELVVRFIEPVIQSVQFTVSGEVRLPRDGQIEIPLIRLTSAERESGGVGVEVLGAGEIRERRTVGLEEVEAAELGPLVSNRQSPSLVAFRLRAADGGSRRSLSLGVARYTPQAVLTANVEEARYSTLVTPDGKMLVQARLAVRNNQRNFLKVNLPSGAVLWSAAVAGRPVRPGLTPDGSLLLPLEKMRAGEASPEFSVEVVYVDRIQSWSDKGRAQLSLLTLDLPISKSGLLLYHSPLFKITAVPGGFRVANYSTPESTSLRSASVASPAVTAQSPSPDSTKDNTNSAQELVSRVQSAGRSGTIRNLPIRVGFLHLGPSMFLVSELTSESQTPTLEVDYQRDRKGGVR
jgi:hypothetical protein